MNWNHTRNQFYLGSSYSLTAVTLCLFNGKSSTQSHLISNSTSTAILYQWSYSSPGQGPSQALIISFWFSLSQGFKNKFQNLETSKFWPDSNDICKDSPKSRRSLPQLFKHWQSATEVQWSPTIGNHEHIWIMHCSHFCCLHNRIWSNIFCIFHFLKFFLVPFVLDKHWRDRAIARAISDSMVCIHLENECFLWLSRSIIPYNEKEN